MPPSNSSAGSSTAHDVFIVHSLESLRQLLPKYVDVFDSTQSVAILHDLTECRSSDADEARIIRRNPRSSLSLQLCKVLEADLGPRFKFINLAHQF